MPGTRKLGKPTAARMAMLRQQVTDLLDTGRMETTITRAKEIRPLAEKMITLGKKKGLANYRLALSFLTREDVAGGGSPQGGDRRGIRVCGIIHSRSMRKPGAIRSGTFLLCSGRGHFLALRALIQAEHTFFPL